MWLRLEALKGAVKIKLALGMRLKDALGGGLGGGAGAKG